MNRCRSIIACAVVAPALSVPWTPSAAAETLPPSSTGHAYVVSPEVYRLLNENEHFRVMLAVWKPGQSDDWHTHHGDLVNYNLTDCQLKGVLPDGRTGELVRKSGEAGFNSRSVHKVTNVGKSECVLLIVERK